MLFGTIIKNMYNLYKFQECMCVERLSFTYQMADGKLVDQRSPLREDLKMIPQGVVYVTDNGYFGLPWLKEVVA